MLVPMTFSGDLEVRDAMDQMFLPDYPLITLISCGLTFDQIWQVTEVVEKRTSKGSAMPSPRNQSLRP